MTLNIGDPISIEHETDTNAWTNVLTKPVNPGDIVAVRVAAVARRESNGDCAFWEQRALFRRDDTDPVTLIGSLMNVVAPIKTLGAALWDFRLRVDEDDYFYIDVKGASGQNVGWVIFGDGVIVDYPV